MAEGAPFGGRMSDNARRSKLRGKGGLWAVVKFLPGDYDTYGGDVERDPDGEDFFGPDCSMGCVHFHPLYNKKWGADMDWGVCANPKSHRAGLLTWEHMGCPLCEFRGMGDSEGE